MATTPPLTFADEQVLHGSDMNNLVQLIMSRPPTYQTSGVPSNGFGNDGDVALDNLKGVYYTKAGGAWSVGGHFVPPQPGTAVMPAAAGDTSIPVFQNGNVVFLDGAGWKANILASTTQSGGGGTVTVTGGRTFRDIRDYNVPTDGSDCSAAFNQAMRDIQAAGAGGLFVPYRSAGYNINAGIDLGIFAGGNGPMILGEGGDGACTTFNQVGSNPVFKCIGTSSATNGGSPSGFIFGAALVNIFINVSGAEYQSDGVTPVRALDFRACYQLYWENVNVNGGITQHFYIQEVWDSSIVRSRFTGGGHCNPFASAGSNGRTLIAALENRCGFTIGVPCCEIYSPDTLAGQDNSNNIRFEDCRWETSPLSAIMLLIHGKDGVRFSFRGCKMETREAVRPVVAMFDQASIDLGDLWLMGDGNATVPSWAPADCGPHGTAYNTAGTAPAVAWFDNCYGVTGHNVSGGTLGGSNWDSWIRFHYSSNGLIGVSGMFNLFCIAVLPLGITGGSLVKDTGGTAPGIVRGSQPPWFTPTIPAFYSDSIPVEISGTASPNTGTYARGSRCWFTAPSASSAPGSVCVASGSPGVWKNMANLSA